MRVLLMRLYASWSKRLAAEVTAPVMRAMQQLAQDAGEDRIRPLDEGF